MTFTVKLKRSPLDLIFSQKRSIAESNGSSAEEKLRKAEKKSAEDLHVHVTVCLLWIEQRYLSFKIELLQLTYLVNASVVLVHPLIYT